MTGSSRVSGALPANDPQDMTARVVGLPDQIRAAWRLAADGPDLLARRRPARVYVCGMGGSAIGGDFLRAFASVESRVPVEVVRGYELPAAAGTDSVALLVSYSGDTEETLSVWADAVRRDVPRAVVTGGGELGRLADADGAPRLLVPGGSPPRAAFGWTSVPQLAAFGAAGLAPFGEAQVEEAAAACEEVIARHGPDAAEDDALRTWAVSCVGRLPLVYAPAAPYAPCAVRWATQLNENAKSLAHSATFPEQNHNEIVGWEIPGDLHSRTAVAFLGAETAHPRVRRRMEIVADVVRRAGGVVGEFQPAGESLAARLYSLAALGDLASLHLAAARGVDPTPVASIDRLKAELGAARPGNG